ncbi:MAG: LytR/AlgR family response regulator transcription factor [Solirubrobacteraceae bacterium]
MSQAGLTVLAVDDEQTQLEDLARLLRDSPAVRSVDCAAGGPEALVKLASQPFDAIFLDVRMPDLDGVELARVLRRFAAPPQLVFVSAYDSAAVDAFELRALDYLLKPVSRRRLEESLERVASAVSPGSANGEAEPEPRKESEIVAVANLRPPGSTRLISRSSILYVQSHGDFVRIVVDEGRYLLRTTLTELEHRWEPFGFARVHRQYLANLAQAQELQPQLGGTALLSFAGGHTIPVARRHVAELSRRLSV